MSAAAARVFRLYLLRHAQAGWAPAGQKDFDRTLDETGYAQAEFVADLAADRRYRPDRILCSTAARCRETADAMRRAVGEDLDIAFTDALYAGPASVYRDLIDAQAHGTSLMVIGHNPMIEELLRDILGETGAGQAIPLGYPCAGLAVLDVQCETAETETPRGRLLDFLSSSQ